MVMFDSLKDEKLFIAYHRLITLWKEDWNRFVRDALGATLDREQQQIISSVQFNPRTSVASGTSRGKDFVAACAALSFLYLTPRWNTRGELVQNTKIALTAPTDRQVKIIMMPEISRLWNRAKTRVPGWMGRLNSFSIRFDNDEWFLAGFKADENNHEAWSGFHAVNTMFVVTEASGMSENVFSAIEGNLQNNSRILIVFNPNTTTGYAAKSQKESRWAKFKLNSLNAENVIRKKVVYPGQVDYEWVKDKVDLWCSPIQKSDFNEGEGDFEWEGRYYRPNDLFRIKVLGMFPKVSNDVLIPYEWIELANRRWEEYRREGFKTAKSCRLGIDVAGMGRDSSVLIPRFGSYVPEIISHHSAGQADHMKVAGMAVQYLRYKGCKAFVDTIGEGAGVWARLREQGWKNAFSCKFSAGARELHDVTGQYTFANMKAYLYWAVRDWLDPKNNNLPAFPPDDRFMEEATEIKYFFQSNGAIAMEKKEETAKRLRRSPDTFDALANTFYPYNLSILSDEALLNAGL